MTTTSTTSTRRTLKSLVLALLLVLSFSAVFSVVPSQAAITAQAASRKSSVKISKKKLTLQPGKKATLKLSGKNAGRAVWSTTNPSVVTVTGKGKKATLKAAANGSAYVTANAGGKVVKCKVTVKTALAVSQTNVAVAPGRKFTLKASGTLAKRARWTSSNKAVASVKGKGKKATITAKKTGKAILAVRSGNIRVKCTITVTKNPETLGGTPGGMKSGMKSGVYYIDLTNIPHTHNWVPVQVGTKTVVDKEAWDETWEEPVYESHNICGQCGQDFHGWTETEIDVHIGKEMLSGKGSRWYSDLVKVGTEQRTAHHDAVTHQEPVFEDVCSICGAKK